jgi:hypothetical protein
VAGVTQRCSARAVATGPTSDIDIMIEIELARPEERSCRTRHVRGAEQVGEAPKPGLTRRSVAMSAQANRSGRISKPNGRRRHRISAGRDEYRPMKPD